MNRRIIWAAMLAAATSLTTSALAADLPRKAPVYVPPPPVSDWSGVYVGIEDGYGWGHQNFNAVIPGDCFSCDLSLAVSAPTGFDQMEPLQQFFPDVALGNVKQRGWLFGGFFGAQKQWGSWGTRHRG